jgi:threonyl-tRNA synthetase
MKNEKSEKLHNLRHSLAHILASAVQEMFPKAQLGVGPVIEHGFYYDFLLPRPLTPQDLAKLEKRMRELVKQHLGFEKQEMTSGAAKAFFTQTHQPFKIELLKDIEKYGTTKADEILNQESSQMESEPKHAKGEATVTLYKTGKFIDLCRGGHVKSTKEIDTQSFKLDKISGAYWRGNQANPQMQRIYGLAFETKNELDKYLLQREESEKRDHRKLGQQLGIFTFADEIGQGLPLWLPNGTIVRDELEKWAKETEEKWGYKRVSTPHITKDKLYEISGHLPFYADDMYSPINIEGEKYYLKPMNCPHHHMIYKSSLRSYRELPLRIAEYGQLYRFELSGALHGLMRVRGFSQNDAHIYLSEKDVVKEFVDVMKMHKYYYAKLGIKNFKVKLGLRDPKNLRKKYHGDEAMWEKAEKLTREGLDKSGVEYTEDIGGAAHYGPKGDVIIESVIGTEYAIGTVQVDMFMPTRFNLEFINEKGEKETPVVIHRAPLGSHERMVGFLLEHFAGVFPTWLAPIQAAVLPITDKQKKYAKQVFTELKDLGIRVVIDERNESVGKKIREAEVQKIPYMLIIGEKEMKSKKVSVRLRNQKDLGAIKLDKLQDRIVTEILGRKL